MDYEVRSLTDEIVDENNDIVEVCNHSVMMSCDVGDITNFALVERLRINGQWFLRMIDQDREEKEWNRRKK